MLTLNSTSKFQCSQYPAGTPTFKGNGDKPLKHNALQQDLFQKAESRHLHEQSEQKLIRDWNEFKHRFDGYTAPAMKEAVQRLTDNLTEQARLSRMYTRGAQQRYEEHTPADVQAHHQAEQDKKPKFLVLS